MQSSIQTGRVSHVSPSAWAPTDHGRSSVSHDESDKYIEIDPTLFRKMGELRAKHLSVVMTKGESDIHRINLRDIDKLLSTLRRNASKQTNTLEESLKHTYQRFRALVSLLSYPYSSVYLKLYHRIEKHFGDLRSIKPGTIGAYCIGSRFKTNLPPTLATVSPISAGAAPLPDLIREMEIEKSRADRYSLTAPADVFSDRLPSELESRIGAIFYLSKGDGENYTLKRLDRTPQRKDDSSANGTANSDSNKKDDTSVGRTKDIGVLFLPVRAPHLFQGLSKEERHRIKESGVEHFLLYGSDDNGRHYILFDNNGEMLTQLDQIKTRISAPRWKHNRNPLRRARDYNEQQQGETLYIVIGIILLILILGAGYLYQKARLNRD